MLNIILHIILPAQYVWQDITLTTDKEQSRAQLLEDDDPLSLVDSGKNDGNDTGGQAGAEAALVLGEEVGGGAGCRPVRRRAISDFSEEPLKHWRA